MFKENIQSISEALDTKSDADLESLIARCQSLLASRDKERKAKALAEAKKIAAAAGLHIMEKKTRKHRKRKASLTQNGDE